MLTTIKGYYDNGHIVMTEEPPVHDRTDVIITFLSEEKHAPKKRTLGLLEGKIRLSDDFDEPLDECGSHQVECVKVLVAAVSFKSSPLMLYCTALRILVPFTSQKHPLTQHLFCSLFRQVACIISSPGLRNESSATGKV